MVKIRIPSPMREFTGGKDIVHVAGQTIGDALGILVRDFPQTRARLFKGETWELNRFVNIFFKDEDIRHLQGLDTPTENGAEISIVPAVAGGC